MKKANEASPKKASPKKASPKKASPEKASPEASPEKASPEASLKEMNEAAIFAALSDKQKIFGLIQAGIHHDIIIKEKPFGIKPKASSIKKWKSAWPKKKGLPKILSKIEKAILGKKIAQWLQEAAIEAKKESSPEKA